MKIIIVAEKIKLSKESKIRVIKSSEHLRETGQAIAPCS